MDNNFERRVFQDQNPCHCPDNVHLSPLNVMNIGITNNGIHFQYKTQNWFQTLFKFYKQKYKIAS